MDQVRKVLASAVQEQFWLIQRLNPDATGYHVPSLFIVEGAFDLVAFQKSINAIFARHEIFRTVFDSEDGKLFQVIKPHLTLACRCSDLSGEEVNEESEKIKALVQKEVDLPFNLGAGPLVRVLIIQLSGGKYLLLIVMHHIITDLRSNTLFAEELSKLYSGFSRELDTGVFSNSAPQYSEYSIWHNNWLNSDEHRKMLESWRETIRQRDGYLNLPHDNLRPKMETFTGGASEFHLDVQLVDSLKKKAALEKCNLFLLLLASYFVMLHRYSGQEEVIVGVPFTNRRREDLKYMMGCFVNNMPIALNVLVGMSFSELLQQLKKEMLLAHRRQEVPFREIAYSIEKKKNLAYNPLFQVGFTFQPPMQLQLDGLFVTSRTVRSSDSQLDLFPVLWEERGEIFGAVDYNSSLFEKETVDHFVEHWKTLLNSLFEQEALAVGELPILDPKEKDTLLNKWNATYRDYPTHCCLHTLFEEQVEKTPDATALCCDEVVLSYKELNRRANQLGHYLQKRGVGPESLVGVFMERSVEMVVALYGILKAGGAYVSLDPGFPMERLSFMVEDAGLDIVLTQKHLDFAMPDRTLQILPIDSEWPLIAQEQNINPLSEVTEKNLAYVLFTSGSTGRPKGVMNQHDGICNRLFWMQDEFQLTSDDRVLQKTPYSFDVSVWEFFWPLQVGAALVVAPPDSHYDPDALLNLIEIHRITTIHFVPSMLQLFLDRVAVEDRCKRLRYVVCSGEALSHDLQVKFFNCFPVDTIKLYNLYGPTEAAVDVTSWCCKPSYEKAVVPIGRPISNTQLYIVDQFLQPTPVGVAGELLIGGVQVARGYINRPVLSKKSFINDCFSALGGRLYRTGDLARYRSDGIVEYLGRLDYQVKIHGLRIELGEIEAIASSHCMVRQSVVVLIEKPSGGKAIVLYVVSEGEGDQDVDSLKKDIMGFLSHRLPVYMVPSFIIILSGMPLTTSGKVNRKELPAPVFESATVNRALVSIDPTEKRIFRIWQRVLNHTAFSITHNFFDVGGDSLLAVMVIEEIKKEFKLEIPVIKLFEYPTVKKLTKYIITYGEVSAGETFVKKNVVRQKAMLSRRKAAKGKR